MNQAEQIETEDEAIAFLMTEQVSQADELTRHGYLHAYLSKNIRMVVEAVLDCTTELSDHLNTDALERLSQGIFEAVVDAEIALQVLHADRTPLESTPYGKRTTDWTQREFDDLDINDAELDQIEIALSGLPLDLIINEFGEDHPAVDLWRDMQEHWIVFLAAARKLHRRAHLSVVD